MAGRMMAENGLGAWRGMDAEELGADRDSPIGADFEDSALTPDKGPPGALGDPAHDGQAEEHSVLGWSALDLQGRRKGDPQKVRIAARLRRETTMTLQWIADRLCMGAGTHVAFLLQHHQRDQARSEDTLF
jgi:hypothetical protein